MKIRYATKQRWFKEINPDLLSDFSKSNAKKLRKFLPAVAEKEITHVFKEVDEDFLTLFEPLYQEIIGSKANSNPRNIFETTIGKPEQRYTYLGLLVYDKDTLVGGMIYTLREDRLSIVYRAFYTQWPNQEKSRCNPALYGEYLITEHSVANNLHALVHGQDSNPYGLNSAIGVAIFKLSIGCYPTLPKTIVTEEMEIETCSEDILLLEYPEIGTRITKAHLVVRAENEAKYEQLLSTNEILEIVVHHRS